MQIMNRFIGFCLLCLLGLVALSSCAEKLDNSYPEAETRALHEWMKIHHPELVENYQEDGDYYVDVISLGNTESPAVRDTVYWVHYEFTARDLHGNVSITRDSIYAQQQGTFTRYTHYVPYYKYCGELTENSFREGTHLAMRNILTLGESYATARNLPREIELREGTEVLLYMPSSIVSVDVSNGDGGYEGQYKLSANHPMIARVTVRELVKNPVESEGLAVDRFAGNNGGRIENGVAAEDSAWKLASTEAAQVYFSDAFNPADERSSLFTYTNPYYGSQVAMSDLDRRINRALLDRFGESEPGDSVKMDQTAYVWYVARFLDGFVQSTNIDEVKEIIYGEVESQGVRLAYNPEVNEEDEIRAWHYCLAHYRYGEYGALLTTSSYAYGSTGIVGTTRTSSSSSAYDQTAAMLNYYNMMNSYYGGGYMGNYYNDFYGSYMGGYYNGTSYAPYYYTNDTSSTTTVVTEVLPFTPLLIEFYIEPRDD